MSTVQPKNTSCNLEHCPGSKRYDVKMLVFNSIPLNNMANPDYETEWHKVEKRQTSFLFSDSVIFSEKYFLFQLRNRNKRRSRYGYYVPHEPIQTESSGLFYFGEQGMFLYHAVAISTALINLGRQQRQIIFCFFFSWSKSDRAVTRYGTFSTVWRKRPNHLLSYWSPSS